MADNDVGAYDPGNIFAKMLKGEIPCHKIYEDGDTMAFLDIMPRTEGHALVITKEPAVNLFAISAQGLDKLMAVVQNHAPHNQAAIGADGVKIQQYNGAAAGQTVVHLHVHILPIKDGVPVKPHAGDTADPKELKAIAEKIKAVLKG